MNKEDTKQAILGFIEFFKGITGNQDLKIPDDIAKKYEIEHEVKICDTCAHYGEDLHGTNCRFCSDKKLWEPKVVSEDDQRGE